MGHKNLNKVLVPRVISMAEEFIIAPRRSHARTVRPRQWHVTRRGHIVERERALGRGLALAASTHKGLRKVSDGTNTQVLAWMITK